MENVEYANSQLNEIMRKYKENESNRELFFAEEREASIQKQKEENKRINQDNKKLFDQTKQTIMDAPPAHPTEGALRD
jgi:AAA15 family ATPase/GTPase